MAFEQRVTGFLGHWMHFGGQQMLIFALLGAFLLLGPKRRRLWWVVLGIVTVSIVLGLTRGVWLGCFVASVFLAWRWKPRALWALPALALVLLLASPSLVRERIRTTLRPSTEPALSIRFEMWQVALRMIRAHSWLGVGPNNVEQTYPLYLPAGQTPQVGYHGHLHNNVLHLAAERGLPALAAWVWLVVAWGWHCWKARGRLKELRWVADGVLAGWLAFLTQGFFEFNFGSSPVLMLFLFLVSAPLIAEHLEQAAERGRNAEAAPARS
jgi:O-antigen ligase